MTVSEAFRQDLEAVKQALSHKIPDGKLQDVLRECLRVTLEAYTKKRRAHRMRSAGHVVLAKRALPRAQPGRTGSALRRGDASLLARCTALRAPQARICARLVGSPC